MINTYNESSLHNTIKHIISCEYEGVTEQKIENWICDIVCQNKQIYEVQTSNVSKLKDKIKDLTDKGYKVTVVYPLVTTKYIKTIKSDGSLKSVKKSPKSNTIYTLPKQLTGLYTLTGITNFSIIVLDVEITETRRETDEKVQLINKSRKYLKNWIPEGKALNQITGKRELKTLNDYIKAFIPNEIITSEAFTATDLKKAIYNNLSEKKINESSKKNSSKEAGLIIWLLLKMNVIKLVKIKGRSKYYSFIK